MPSRRGGRCSPGSACSRRRARRPARRVVLVVLSIVREPELADAQPVTSRTARVATPRPRRARHRVADLGRSRSRSIPSGATLASTASASSTAGLIAGPPRAPARTPRSSRIASARAGRAGDAAPSAGSRGPGSEGQPVDVGRPGRASAIMLSVRGGSGPAQTLLSLPPATIRAVSRAAPAVFWLSAAPLVWAQALYGLFLARCGAPARRRSRPRAPSGRPQVSLIVAAYREQDVIAAKVANALALDWPRDALRADRRGRRRRTARIHRRLAAPRGPTRCSSCRAAARCARRTPACGPPAGICWSSATPTRAGSPTRSRRLVAAFADPEVGYACGQVLRLRRRHQPGGRLLALRAVAARAGVGAGVGDRGQRRDLRGPARGLRRGRPGDGPRPLVPVLMVKRGWRAVYVPRRGRRRRWCPTIEGDAPQAADDEPRLADRPARRDALPARLRRRCTADDRLAPAAALRLAGAARRYRRGRAPRSPAAPALPRRARRPRGAGGGGAGGRPVARRGRCCSRATTSSPPRRWPPASTTTSATARPRAGRPRRARDELPRQARARPRAGASAAAARRRRCWPSPQSCPAGDATATRSTASGASAATASRSSSTSCARWSPAPSRWAPASPSTSATTASRASAPGCGATRSTSCRTSSTCSRARCPLVGPRPTVQVQVDQYTDRQRGRLDGAPGHHGLGAGQRPRVAALARAHRARPLVRRARLARAGPAHPRCQILRWSSPATGSTRARPAAGGPAAARRPRRRRDSRGPCRCSAPGRCGWRRTPCRSSPGR